MPDRVPRSVLLCKDHDDGRQEKGGQNQRYFKGERRDFSRRSGHSTGLPNQKKILNKQNISGVFHPGRFTAVMGASGAGKTSFLNILAGEVKLGEISGEVLVNGQPVFGAEMKKISGFVFQDDVILPTMTVREAIMMSAILRLPSTLTHAEKVAKVDAVISQLNLRKCADSTVGDALMKGVSGGERKRCAMAMEMITNPQVLFLDEPTSGLDTFTAFTVIDTLRSLAHTEKRTIVATIHQPSSEIFHLFDDLLLLSEGRIMYHGPAHHAVAYFRRLGYPCPKRSNPADFLFYRIVNNEDGVNSLVGGSLEWGSKELEEKEKMDAYKDETNAERIERLLGQWAGSVEELAVRKVTENPAKNGVSAASMKSASSLWTQFRFLIGRESKDTFRNPLILRERTIKALVTGIIVGLLYLKKTGQSFSDFKQNTMGVLFFISVTNVFAASQSNLSVFGKAKLVFAREFGAGYYQLFPYFIAKVAVEVPLEVLLPWLEMTIMYFMAGLNPDFVRYIILASISVLGALVGFSIGVCLACAFSTLQVALQVTPIILLPMMLFAGFFVNLSLVPIWLRWLQFVSPMKYGFQAAVRSQFENTPDGDVIIGQVISDALSVKACCGLLVAMMVLALGAAYILLSRLVSSESAQIKPKGTGAAKAAAA
ncbi:P-loop containing nucleoside triphosphate hydrolase protein [Zopfochytrium polystomum]|nr:P-loop containing nucleoside triphosphate hydrolase protein [Zopfochytrium polystomum]